MSGLVADLVLTACRSIDVVVELYVDRCNDHVLGNYFGIIDP